MGDLRSGDALGASYRLVELAGSGAAGDVWKVDAVADGAGYAAKILKAEHAADPELVERFVRERSVLLGLRHPNIVEVRDLVVEGATLAIVMEFVAGGSLRDLLEERKTLPAADALALCSQVFQALAAAHARQITHRDIKPDNVLLTMPWASGQSGTVRVTDFGIASVVSERNRQTTGLLGTPQYMAPELISHGQTTPAADVYSAGVLLYELLAGRTPFAGPGTDFTIAYRHVTSVPPTLDLPGPLWSMVDRLLAKDPRERPAAADAAVELLRLAENYRSLVALEPAAPVDAFVEAERPATMLRGDLMPVSAPSDAEPALSREAPELGEGGGRTILRSMPRRAAESAPRVADAGAVAAKAGRTHVSSWLTKRNIVLAAIAIVLVAGVGVGIAVLGLGKKPAGDVKSATEAVQATQQDAPLPSGLTVSRKAQFDPAAGRISLEVTYTAQKAPLTGSFFQAVPALPKGGSCPAVTWKEVSATRHQQSTTGLKADCGWALEGLVVPANGHITATATITASVKDAAALNTWLGAVATATTETITDANSTSTAYPAQRLQNITVDVPPRAVSQTPLTVTLIPVWPSGPDELNPLFRSPQTGAPSQMLTDVAGTGDSVRFSDGCSGAVSVAPDNTTVTALSVTSDCRLRATVGNFTDLQSNPFSITTRE